MNPPYQNRPSNVTTQLVDSIYEIISKESNSNIGKKRKAKLKQMLRQNLMQGNGQQSASARQELSNIMSANNNSFQEALDDFDMPPTIEFSSGGAVINLCESTSVYTSSNCQIFNDFLLSSAAYWHMILIYRQRRFKKKDILESLYSIVKFELFAPFAYRENRDFDYFLICNQVGALQKLFEAGLKIQVHGVEMELAVKTRVASVSVEHPKLVDIIRNVLLEKMNSSGDEVLDLSHFGQSMSYKDVNATLGNKGMFNLLCDQINGINKLKEKCRNFKFSYNKIQSLESFTKLFGFTMNVLVLTDNKIPNPQDFHYLKHLEVKKLFMTGNECANIPNYRERIHEIVTSLTEIDERSLDGNAIMPDVKDVKKKAKFGCGIGNEDIPQIDDGVLIRGNVRKGVEFKHLRDTFPSYRNDQMWTQVQIEHKNAFTKEEIFEEIVPKLFSNQPFFPCYFKHFLNFVQFYVYKNFEILKILMMNDLEYQMPNFKKLFFSIRLNVAPFKEGQVDWVHKMNHVVLKRFKNNLLDINGFTDDPDFSKMIVPMNSKFTLNFIIEQAKKHGMQITRINAQNNGITTLEGLHSLYNMTKLQVLDLRNNKIFKLDGMSMTTTIKELMLDGNPICERYSEPSAYIGAIGTYFHQVEWIDGHHVDKTQSLVTLRNFLVKRDAYTMAADFVKTFFTIYDSFERQRLIQMFNEKSFFSLSIQYAIDRNPQQDDIYPRVQRYTKLSRNLHVISNMSKVSDNMMCGKKSIDNVYNMLPKTTHDFSSFCIDVPFFDPNEMVVITVSGVFDEHGTSLNETNFLLGFARTFILRPSDNDEYVISNDQLFIHNPSMSQRDESVLGRKQPDKDTYVEKHCRDLLPTETEDKKVKLIMFQELTELKKDECIRQLEESFWDIKVALATFNTLMDSREMPDSKFNFK